MMSQIRNHFIFNALGAISGYCKIDPAKADEALMKFSRYLRRNMSWLEEKGMIPFENEFKQVEDYVYLEKMRFGDRFELGDRVKRWKSPDKTENGGILCVQAFCTGK